MAQIDLEKQDWEIVNDVVMGGLSNARFERLNDYSLFSGNISIENNGGFSSVKYPLERMDLRPFKSFRLRVKGDGKTYQFRVKSKAGDTFSYKYPLVTNGEWQDFTIPFHSMIPVFRGKPLGMSNFNGKQIEELSILLTQPVATSFNLLIDKLEVI